MQEEKKQTEKTQTKIELQVIPCNRNVAKEKQGPGILNHDSQDDCKEKIILTITCEGPRMPEIPVGTMFEEWLTVSVEASEKNCYPNFSANSHSKLTKADSGRV